MATIKEVANLAGVSVSTVSRVVNETKYVSPDVEKRVRAAIDELGYQASAFARGLRVQESKTVGVLIPALNEVFFSQFAFIVEKELYKNGYHPLFCNIEDSAEKEARYIDILLQQQVDAVIIVPGIPSKMSVATVQKLMQRDIPVVVVERPLPDLTVNQVLVDNFNGGYIGAEYLLKQGHEHVGVIAATTDLDKTVFAPGHERIKGIRAAYGKRGLAENIIIHHEDDIVGIELGYLGTKKLMEKSPKLSVIFALTDDIAVGVYHAANDLGLRIPENLSVLGYDNIPIASHVVPQLTTIAQPIDKLGKDATTLLLQNINNPKMKAQSIMLKTELIERQSVRKIDI